MDYRNQETSRTVLESVEDAGWKFISQEKLENGEEDSEASLSLYEHPDFEEVTLTIRHTPQAIGEREYFKAILECRDDEAFEFLKENEILHGEAYNSDLRGISEMLAEEPEIVDYAESAYEALS